MPLLNLFDYQAAARGKVPDMFYDYVEGGANDEITLRENHAAFERIGLRPRVLVNVEKIDLHTTILGTPIDLPVILGMTAVQKVCHPDGEIATSRAAHALGTIATLGTLSTYSIDQVRAKTDGPLWYQLYTYKDQAINRDLIQQGVEGGALALMITVDTPLLGHRERDLRNQFKVPADMPAVHLEKLPMEDTSSSAQGLSGVFRNYEKRAQHFTWKDLDSFRAMAGNLPLILKGIMTAEDAKLALENGVDAILISNHGGRQLDTCIPTIEALLEIVEAVEGKIPVMIDGGIRRGTDVIKALAVGASAVVLGRPPLWGLAVNGEAGVRHVLELLRDEISLAMALCGKTSLKELDRSLLRMPR